MKIEIELTEYHANLLKHISDYSEIGINKLVKEMIICHIEKFDADMQEFLEQSLSSSYYDDYSGRYME